MSLFGLLNLNKPPGVTSRHAVDLVKRLVKPDKVGHAGTLDPLASGVLVVGVGQATRLMEYVQLMQKTYVATFLLGRTSDTEDIEGDVTELANAPIPTREQLVQAAAALVGDVLQRPPAYSALKVGGRRSYARARAGQIVELAMRTVHIERIEIVDYDYPQLILNIECGSGTYVRSLGRDLAERVGTGVVMSALVRKAIGHFHLDDAVAPQQLTRENLLDDLLPPQRAVEDWMPLVHVEAEAAARLGNGLRISLDHADAETCAAVAADDRLVAILTRRPDGLYTPSKFFPSDR